MPQVNDARYAKLGALGFTGHTNDRLLKYLKANGATSNQVNDAWDQFLTAKGFPKPGTLNDRWFKWLGSLGYTGALSDRWLKFWSAP